MNNRWQYQSLFEPISQRPENITLDKWFQELSSPVLPKFVPYYYPSEASRNLIVLFIPGDGLDLFDPQLKAILPDRQLKAILPDKQLKAILPDRQLKWIG